MFQLIQYLRSMLRAVSILGAACCLCFCSGMSGPGGGSAVGGSDPVGALSTGGGNGNSAVAVNPPNHAVGGGDDGSGTNPQGVPSTQDSTTAIPGPSAVAFQVQVKVIGEHDKIQACQTVPSRNYAAATSLGVCASTSTMTTLSTGTKALGTAANCDNPQPSPSLSPYAPIISFQFTRTGADPQNATDSKTLNAVCLDDGTWKAPPYSLTFRYAGSLYAGQGPENPFSINASATFNSDGKTYASAPVLMPPFPERSSDNTIPVVLTIDLNGEPVAGD